MKHKLMCCEHSYTSLRETVDSFFTWLCWPWQCYVPPSRTAIRTHNRPVSPLVTTHVTIIKLNGLIMEHSEHGSHRKSISGDIKGHSVLLGLPCEPLDLQAGSVQFQRAIS